MATKPHRWMIMGGALALTLAACSSGSGVQVVGMSDNGTTPPAATTAATTAGTTPDTTADTTADTTVDTVTTEPVTSDSTADTVPGQQLPMGDPDASVFTYEASFSGVSWTGYLAGVVEPAKGQYNEDIGNCVVLLGTLMPTALRTGHVSPAFDVPTMSLVAGGQQVESTSYSCDETAVEAAGYGAASDASLTVGTSYAFYTEFFVPGAVTPSLDSIAIGDPTEDGATYFTPSVVTTIPTPPPASIGKLDMTLTPVTDPAGAAFTYASQYGVTDWSGVVLGTTEAPPDEFSDVTGRCLTVFGVISPSKLSHGTVASGYDSPSMSIIVGGRSLTSSYQCSTSPAEAAGYLDLNGATVTVGTTYPFSVQFFIPGDPNGATPATTVQAIGLGDTTSDDAKYFAPPTPATAIAPAPAITAGPLVHDLIPTDDPAAAVFTYVDPYSTTGTTWSGTVQGLVDTAFVDGSTLTGRCLVLVGSITPTAITDGTVTSGYDAPPIAIVAGGKMIRSTSFDCVTTDVEAAGYHEETDAAVAVGTPYRYSLSFVVADPAATLDAIVVGDPTGDDGLYFTPLVLPAVPAGG